MARVGLVARAVQNISLHEQEDGGLLNPHLPPIQSGSCVAASLKSMRNERHCLHRCPSPGNTGGLVYSSSPADPSPPVFDSPAAWRLAARLHYS